MSHFKKFVATILVGVAALISQFAFGQPKVAFLLVAILGGIVALSMVKEMIATLKSGRYGVDILAITAIVATLAVGQYWASLMILIMLTGGDSLEDYASQEASRELRHLLNQAPQQAHRIAGKELQDVTLDQVKIGDRLLVKPQEIVPVDGLVVAGASEVDESSLTGEAKPVAKEHGDEVMSGSVNGAVALQIKVSKLAQDSQYQTIVKLVKESQAKPAHFVRLADRYAVPFTILAYLIGGIAWFVTKDPVRFAQVLVVASPCPLILAAPIALIAGMSRSSRKGMIVKTGTTIEKMATLKTVAFDKTGTITAGTLAVEAVIPEGPFEEEELLALAAGAEESSTHILARSLVQYGKSKVTLHHFEEVKEVVGQGIETNYQGKVLKIGSAAFAGVPKVGTGTAIYLSWGDQSVGRITFKDQIRPEAAVTIAKLRSLGTDQVMMITGDQAAVADQIAQNAGITTVHANCLPQDKLLILKNVPANERPLMMVGDGVNDAPALAIADVGVAMGARGSSAASESAAAVVLKDDLSCVADGVQVAQETMKIAKQSVLIGLFCCVVLMMIAAFGVIPTLLGAILQEVVDTLSILSALRAKNDR